MSTDPHGPPRPLPDRPSLRHLKDQAKDLLKSGAAGSVSAAQRCVARLYGFASWPKLKARVESLTAAGRLKQAIDANDLPAVTALMTRDPALHRAPLGYARNGPLTWAAECRGPASPPAPSRLAIAKWMLDHGSDVHQGGDGPLMRAALSGERVPMMELLVAHGADVNAAWNGNYPIVFAPCETVDPVSLQWLLRHGANPNPRTPGADPPTSALDYVIGSYVRSPALSACIDLLIEAGGTTRYEAPPVLALLRGRLDPLTEHLNADPALFHQRFPHLDFGATGGRRLTLQGATLLHVAAEYQNLKAIDLLLSRGADVNTRAATDPSGVGGQTPLFHAVTQRNDTGLPAANLLIERGADLSVRAKLPGHYEREAEVIECTPLGYALRFQDEPSPADKVKTVELLRERGAPE